MAVEVRGTVKWFNAEKGFGFVSADDGEKDVFIHISVLGRAGLNNLTEGSRSPHASSNQRRDVRRFRSLWPHLPDATSID